MRRVYIAVHKDFLPHDSITSGNAIGAWLKLQKQEGLTRTQLQKAGWRIREARLLDTEDQIMEPGMCRFVGMETSTPEYAERLPWMVILSMSAVTIFAVYLVIQALG